MDLISIKGSLWNLNSFGILPIKFLFQTVQKLLSVVSFFLNYTYDGLDEEGIAYINDSG